MVRPWRRSGWRVMVRKEGAVGDGGMGTVLGKGDEKWWKGDGF